MSAPIFAVDTSCMVAAVCAWHERHEAAAAEIERRLGRGERIVVATHALLESYAVLTRLPAPHRLAPADAWEVLDQSFVAGATLVTLGAPALVRLLGRLSAQGIGGGRSYDAVIGACAAQAKARALLTFNPRHFDPPPEGVAVVEPSDAL